MSSQDNRTAIKANADLIAVTVLLVLLSGFAVIGEGLRFGQQAMRPHLVEIGDELRRERENWRREGQDFRNDARELRREAERIRAEIEHELRMHRDLPARIRSNRL